MKEISQNRVEPVRMSVRPASYLISAMFTREVTSHPNAASVMLSGRQPRLYLSAALIIIMTFAVDWASSTNYLSIRRLSIEVTWRLDLKHQPSTGFVFSVLLLLLLLFIEGF